MEIERLENFSVTNPKRSTTSKKTKMTLADWLQPPIVNSLPSTIENSSISNSASNNTRVHLQSLYYLEYCSSATHCLNPITRYPLRRQLPWRIGIYGLLSIMRELSELGAMLSDNIVLVEYKFQPIDEEDSNTITAIDAASEKNEGGLVNTTLLERDLILVGGDPCYLASEKCKNLYVKIRLVEYVAHVVMDWHVLYDWQQFLKAEEATFSDMNKAKLMKDWLPQIYSVFKRYGEAFAAAYFLSNVLLQGKTDFKSTFNLETGEGFCIRLGRETIELRWISIATNKDIANNDDDEVTNLEDSLKRILRESKQLKWKFSGNTNINVFHSLIDKDTNIAIRNGQYSHPWFIVHRKGNNNTDHHHHH